MLKSVSTFVFLVSVFANISLAQVTKSMSELAGYTKRAQDLFLNEPDSSIYYGKKALALATEKNDLYYSAYSYLLLSKSYWVKANYQLSTEYGFKALVYFEKSNDVEKLVTSQIALARTLTELGNSYQARQLFIRAKHIAEKRNDANLKANVYREYSFLLTETGAFDSAAFYANKGIKLFRETGDSLDVSVLYSRKARIFFKQGNYAESRRFAARGLMMDSTAQNRRALGIAYFQVAQNEFALKQYAKAAGFLKHSIRVNKELGNLPMLVRTHELLARVYQESNEPKLSAREFQLTTQLKDSLYDVEKSGQIQEMQALYDLGIKENKILSLEQESALREQDMENQQLVLIILVVGVSLLACVVFLLVRLRTIQYRTNQDLQQKNNAIEQQKEELEMQAEKLQELNHLNNKLFTVISHDLRGPISNLQTLLDLFTRKLLTAEEFIDISGKLKRNLNVTQRTLENLLRWAMSQMDGLKTEKTIIDLNQSIEEACRLMDESAVKKSIQINRSLVESVYVNVDADQLQMILRNIIHNAIKFSKIGDSISIVTKLSPGHCEVCVQDYGMGMSQTEIEMIQGSPKHFTKPGTAQEKGTGIGLLLCKEFIKRNGGVLMIESDAGRGTKVIFTLELSEALLEVEN